MSDDDEWLTSVANAQPAYARFLGLRVTSWPKDDVDAELTVSP